MDIVASVLSFFARWSGPLSTVAILAILGGYYAQSRGDFVLLRKLSWPLLIVSAPLAVLYVAMAALGSPSAILYALLWGWNGYSALRIVRRR